MWQSDKDVLLVICAEFPHIRQHAYCLDYVSPTNPLSLFDAPGSPGWYAGIQQNRHLYLAYYDFRGNKNHLSYIRYIKSVILDLADPDLFKRIAQATDV